MKHELKIWPQYYERIADGSKTFELRENDRGFQSGDFVRLREWDPTEYLQEESLGSGQIHNSWMEAKGYTGRALEFMVGYILPIENNRVIFSLLPHHEEPT